MAWGTMLCVGANYMVVLVRLATDGKAPLSTRETGRWEF